MRYHHFGEGHYDESEQVIQLLLAEAGDKGYSPELVFRPCFRRGGSAERDRNAIARDLYRLFTSQEFCLARRRRQRRESPLLDRGPEGRLMVVGRRLDGR